MNYDNFDPEALLSQDMVSKPNNSAKKHMLHFDNVENALEYARKKVYDL